MVRRAERSRRHDRRVEVDPLLGDDVPEVRVRRVGRGALLLERQRPVVRDRRLLFSTLGVQGLFVLHQISPLLAPVR